MIVECSSCQRSNRLPAKRAQDRAKCAACSAALLPATHPIALGSTLDFDELVRDAPVHVLVDFWAEWCATCRMVAPELAKIAAETAGRLVIAKVDTDALTEVAARFHIQSIPTMVLFREGKEADRASGAMPASAIKSRFHL